MLAIFFTLQIVSAQSIAPQINTFSTNSEAPLKHEKEKTLIPSDGTSQGNRVNLTYQVTAGIIGTEYIKYPITLSAGYYLHPYGILTLRYSALNTSDDHGAYKMRAVTIGYRRFFGNSFNIMPTIYYKRNTADMYAEGNKPYVVGSNNLVYEDIGTGFRVGNEWQWTNFTMGCDWFGLNLTNHRIKLEEKGLTSDTKAPMKALTMTLLSFYLGYSF